MVKLKEIIERNANLIFWLLILIGVAFHLMTLSFSPCHWIDEVQISEIARGGIVSKSSDWSMCYIGDPFNQKQSWAFYYLGAWFNEVGYNLFGHWGTRVFPLVWLILAAYFSYEYFKRIVGSRFDSLIASIAVFTCPLFVQSARGGRVDMLAVALLFFALFLLRCYPKSRRGIVLQCVAVGMVSSAIVFTWVTGLFLLPIIAWAVFARFPISGDRYKESLLFISYMLIGAIVGCMALSAPFLIDIDQTIENVRAVLQINTNSRGGNGALLNLSALFGIKMYGLTVVGMVFLLCLKRTRLLCLGAVCFILCSCLNTRVYDYRILYILPYMIIACVMAIASFGALRVISRILLIVYCLGFYARSICVRNVVEYLDRSNRNYEEVQRRFEGIIQSGDSIVCDAFQLYYIGRELGWKMYRAGSSMFPSSEVMKKIDWYVSESKVSADKELELQENGFEFFKKVNALSDRPIRYSCGPYFIYRRAR